MCIRDSFESDLEVLAAHPHPEDGFAGMEIRGDLLTDKENAGVALLDACKEVKTSDPVQIGSYRGYAISVEFSAWKQEYTLLLKGQMTHRATLGTDPRGNLTRIDNALAQMPQRLEAAKAQLDNLCQQQAAAKEEVGKPFLYEEELRSKNARLVEQMCIRDRIQSIDEAENVAHTSSAFSFAQNDIDPVSYTHLAAGKLQNCKKVSAVRMILADLQSGKTTNGGPPRKNSRPRLWCLHCLTMAVSV